MTHKSVHHPKHVQQPPSTREILYSAGGKEEVDRMLGVLAGYPFHYRSSQEDGNLGVFDWRERGVKPQQMVEELRRVTDPLVAGFVRNLSADPQLTEAFVKEAVEFPQSLHTFIRVNEGVAQGRMPRPQEMITKFIAEGSELGFLINPRSGLMCVGDAEDGHEVLANRYGIEIRAPEYQRFLKGNIMPTASGKPVVILHTHKFYQPADTQVWVFRGLLEHACRHLIINGMPQELELNVGLREQQERKTVGMVAGGGSVSYSLEDELTRKVKELQLKPHSAGQSDEWVKTFEGKTVRRSDIEGSGYIIETRTGYILTNSRDAADIAAQHGDNVLGFRDGGLYRQKFKHTLHLQAPERFKIL